MTKTSDDLSSTIDRCFRIQLRIVIAALFVFKLVEVAAFWTMLHYVR